MHLHLGAVVPPASEPRTLKRRISPPRVPILLEVAPVEMPESRDATVSLFDGCVLLAAHVEARSTTPAGERSSGSLPPGTGQNSRSSAAWGATTNPCDS